MQIQRLHFAMNTTRDCWVCCLRTWTLSVTVFAVVAASTEQSRTSAQRQRAAREPVPKPFTRASSTAGVLVRLPAIQRLTSVLIAAYTCTLLGFVLQPVFCRYRFSDQQTQAGVPQVLLQLTFATLLAKLMQWCTSDCPKSPCRFSSLGDVSQSQRNLSPPEGHARPGAPPWQAQCPSRARPCGALLVGTAAP
jgi:hypothetical protein